MAEYIDRAKTQAYLYNNMMWYDEYGYIAEDSEKNKALWNLVNGVPTADVIPIPEGATNGDMLTALFGERALITLDTHNYLKAWWNAPYKRESEE